MYRFHGRQRLITVGRCGLLTLQQARAQAQKILAELMIEGVDPLAERKAKAQASTVEELAQRYLAEHAEVKKKANSAKTDRQMLRDYVLP
jgi:hypothetical protein